MSHLKQGMYVRVGHLNTGEVEELVRKFEESGANSIEEPVNYSNKRYPYLVWDFRGDVWCASKPEGYADTEVSVDYVLHGGVKNPTSKFEGGHND